ncbi:hypothetical protein D3C81_1990570 [compost metagenome]
MHAGDDPGDLFMAKAFALHQQQQGIGGGVGVATRSVVLERGFHQRPASAQAVAQARRVGIAGHAGGHALFAFEDIACTAQAIGGQVGGQQAVGGGLGGM